MLLHEIVSKENINKASSYVKLSIEEIIKDMRQHCSHTYPHVLLDASMGIYKGIHSSV